MCEKLMPQPIENGTLLLALTNISKPLGEKKQFILISSTYTIYRDAAETLSWMKASREASPPQNFPLPAHRVGVSNILNLSVVKCVISENPRIHSAGANERWEAELMATVQMSSIKDPPPQL